MGRNLLTYWQSQHNKTLYKLKCFAGGGRILSHVFRAKVISV